MSVRSPFSAIAFCVAALLTSTASAFQVVEDCPIFPLYPDGNGQWVYYSDGVDSNCNFVEATLYTGVLEEESLPRTCLGGSPCIPRITKTDAETGKTILIPFEKQTEKGGPYRLIDDRMTPKNFEGYPPPYVRLDDDWALPAPAGHRKFPRTAMGVGGAMQPKQYAKIVYNGETYHFKVFPLLAPASTHGLGAAKPRPKYRYVAVELKDGQTPNAGQTDTYSPDDLMLWHATNGGQPILWWKINRDVNVPAAQRTPIVFVHRRR